MALRKTLILQLFLYILTYSANNYGCCIEAGKFASTSEWLTLCDYCELCNIVIDN